MKNINPQVVSFISSTAISNGVDFIVLSGTKNEVSMLEPNFLQAWFSRVYGG